MKPHLCCAARHVSPLPHALTQFQILQNYKHLSTSGMRVFSTFRIIILENYVCPFWLKHRSRACERGSLLGPALSLTEVCSVDIKRALEALLPVAPCHQPKMPVLGCANSLPRPIDDGLFGHLNPK